MTDTITSTILEHQNSKPNSGKEVKRAVRAGPRLAVYGRLIEEPRPFKMANGDDATACHFISYIENMEKPDGDLLRLSVLGFGQWAEELAMECKGEPVTLSGRLQQDAHQGRHRFVLILDNLISARRVHREQSGCGGISNLDWEMAERERAS